MKASKFIEKMFAGRTKGNVYLTSFANDRNETRKFPVVDLILTGRVWAQVDKFIETYDVPGRACYFSCSTMMGRQRSKDEVAHINSLFVDLDFKGITEDREQIENVLKNLKLQPTVVVFSGHGLHCYWLLEPPLNVEHSSSCEDIMRRICAALAGDKSAAEVSRVLRLPGSHNSKNDEWLEVAVVKELSSWRTYSVANLDRYFSELDPQLTYRPTKRDAERGNEKPLNPYQAIAREMRRLSGSFDANKMLDEMVFHDVQGNGIDDTMAHVVGAMVSEDATVDQVIKFFLPDMKRVYERDREPGEPQWNERRAIRDIRAKFKYFKRRDEEKEPETPDYTARQSGVGEKAKSKDKGKDKAKPENKKAEQVDKADAKDPKKKKSKHEFDNFDLPEDRKPREFYIEPHDFWKLIPTESMRSGMVPEIIENVAFEYAERNGFNRDALVMSMLTVASSVLPTDIKVAAYNESDNKFIESIRIWTANVGVAGSGKSPILKAVKGPMEEIEAEKRREFNEALEEYNSHTKEEQREMDRPIRERVMIPTDTSTESVQMAFADNPDGLLGAYDELVTFFGSKARYSGKGNGGEQTSRGFWLSTYDSSRFSLTRVNRAEIDCIPSCSIVGGVQPTVLRDLLDEVSRNDGLVQRFNPVILPDKMNPPNKDIKPKYPLTIYEQLIHQMYGECPLRMSGTTLHFSAKAELVRDRMFEWVDEQVTYYRAKNPQLSAHINKFKGMFLRFAGLFHMIENFRDKQVRLISADTANMAYRFLTSVRLKHAECFYSMIIENEQNEDMKNIATFILAHNLEIVSAREIQRGSARFRNISTRDIAHTVGNMVSLGWLFNIVGKRIDSFNWKVNPDVHRLFNEHALAARKSNEEAVQRLAIKKAEKEAEDLPPERLN